MTKNKISYILLLISVICFFLAVKVNVDIHSDYIQSKGKTRALFGIIELKYTFKYYYGILAFICFFVLLILFRKKENRLIVLISMAISFVTIILSFFRVWKLFL